MGVFGQLFARLPAAVAVSPVGEARPKPAPIVVTPKQPVEPLIRVQRVVLNYRTVRALDGVAFDLAPGELAFLVGPTGAGKTSLLRLLAGQLRPTDGEVWVRGRRIDRTSARKRRQLRRTLGIIAHEPALVPMRTALENVAVALEVSDIHLPRAEALRLAERELAAVGLIRRAKAYPAELSTGERRRLVVARALVRKPPIVLADEPTAELDAERARIILDRLVHAATSGATVLIATHDREVVKAARARVLSLQRGRLVGDEEPRRRRFWVLS